MSPDRSRDRLPLLRSLSRCLKPNSSSEHRHRRRNSSLHLLSSSSNRTRKLNRLTSNKATDPADPVGKEGPSCTPGVSSREAGSTEEDSNTINSNRTNSSNNSSSREMEDTKRTTLINDHEPHERSYRLSHEPRLPPDLAFYIPQYPLPYPPLRTPLTLSLVFPP